jgi:hypothetical protein
VLPIREEKGCSAPRFFKQFIYSGILEISAKLAMLAPLPFGDAMGRGGLTQQAQMPLARPNCSNAPPRRTIVEVQAMRHGPVGERRLDRGVKSATADAGELCGFRNISRPG